MARGGGVGPPHITRARSSFNALDMFKQLLNLGATGPTNGRIHATGEFRIHATGEFRIHE